METSSPTVDKPIVAVIQNDDMKHDERCSAITTRDDRATH